MNVQPKRRPTCCIRTFDGDPRFGHEPQNQSPKSNNAQYKLRQTRADVLVAQNHARANVEFLAQELDDVNAEIQCLNKSLKEIEAVISGSLCKTKHPKKLTQLCKLKGCTRIDLGNALYLHNDLKRQYVQARLAFRSTRIAELLVTPSIFDYKREKWYDEVIHENEEKTKQRIHREVQAKLNAIRTREETVISVANSITAHVQVVKDPDRAAEKKHTQGSQTGKHLINTIRKFRENKAIAMTEKQLRARRQLENLAKLKKDIDEIKDALTAKNQIKRIHDEEIALEKEEVKSLLLAQGANPYLAEYLLAIEEKQRDIQRKLLVEEQKRLMEMQREYAVIEASKTKEESDKKKWEAFWSKKAQERVLHERQSKQEKYFDITGEEDEGIEFPQADEHFHVARHNSEEASQKSVKPIVAGPEQTDAPPEESKKKSTSSSNRKNGIRIDAGSAKAGGGGSEGSKKKSVGGSSGRSELADNVAEENVVDVVVSIRRTIHLDYVKKEALLQTAGADVRIMLTDNKNVFDFGDVQVGQRKYVLVNIANLTLDTVKLKMSLLNPYGPFTLCNALKSIPADNYYTLKFRFQPSINTVDETQEIVKIMEVDNPESCITIKLKGHGESSIQSLI